jgi:hypothetical protein
MIQIFTNYEKAITFALNHSEHDLIAMSMGGVSLWIDNDQKIVLPVIVMKKISVMECFTLFAHSMGYNEEVTISIQKWLQKVLQRAPCIRIISMSRWVMDVQFIDDNTHELKKCVAEAQTLNASLVKMMLSEYGRLPVVDAQPDQFYRNFNLIRIGVQ